MTPSPRCAVAPLVFMLLALAGCDAGSPSDASSMPPRERGAPPADDLELEQTGDAPVETREEEGEEGEDSAPEPETAPADPDEDPPQTETPPSA